MKKKLLVLLLVLLSLACVVTIVGCGKGHTTTPPTDGGEQGNNTTPPRVELTSTQVYQKVNPSVVFILITQKNGIASGSGFFIDTVGTVVTNFHVIADGLTGAIQLYNGETASIVNVLGYDETLDIAILSTTAKNTTAAKLGNSSEVLVGDTVYAIGYPAALQVGFSSSTFTTGMVSMNRSLGGYTYIQSTVDITHGNSGGALINTYGEVVGITTAGLNVGDVDYMNLSIPVQRIDTVGRNVNESLEIVTKRHYPVYVTYQIDNSTYLRQTLKYETNPSKPNNPTKIGYTFANWYADKNCTKLFDFNEKIIADTVVYAKFDINSYKVTYNLSSGNWSGTAPATTYTINDCNKELPKAKRSGYIFEGWKDSSGAFVDYLPASSNLQNLKLTASWVQGTEGLTFSTNKKDGYNISGYNGSATNVIVPTTYRNKKITEINRYIFNNNNNIESLSFPVLTIRIGELFSSTSYGGAKEIQQKIGEGTYSYGTYYISSKLKKVAIRSGNIVSGCFSGCDLEEVSLGEEEQNCVACNGYDVFGNIDRLILKKHISVGEYTFSNRSINEIYIDSLDEWFKCNFGNGGYGTAHWGSPFSANTKLFVNNVLLTKLTVPNSVTKINEGVFRGYQFLTEVIIPKQVTRIMGYAFAGCTNLQSVIFKEKNTWYTEYLGYSTNPKKQMSLDDTALNSKNLVKDYVHYIWYKV